MYLVGKRHPGKYDKLYDDLAVYGFWLWEYQRRNPIYIKDYNELDEHRLKITDLILANIPEDDLQDIDLQHIDEDTEQILLISKKHNQKLLSNREQDDNAISETNKLIQALLKYNQLYTNFLNNHWRKPKDPIFETTTPKEKIKWGSPTQYLEVMYLGEPQFDIEDRSDLEIAWRRRCTKECGLLKLSAQETNPDWVYLKLRKGFNITDIGKSAQILYLMSMLKNLDLDEMPFMPHKDSSKSYII